MYRPKNIQERIIHRLKISLGQMKKVIQMVEEDKYCIDVIHQTQAIEKALEETNNLILENHLNSCVADAMKEGNKEEAVKEVMNVFKKRNK